MLKQRELAREAVASAVEGTRPPEIRLGTISANRSVKIKFTNSMDFPDTASFISLNSGLEDELLSVMMLSGDSERIDENLISWSIQTVTPKLITVNLEF